MTGCGKCGAVLAIVGGHVGRSDECPECGSELRACIHCRHFDEGVAKECKEPFAEVPMIKDSANFCELFQIGEGRNRGTDQKEAILSAAEALFKK